MSKRTYSISELAREFGITTRAIRFYEEKGLINPQRNGQRRVYSPADRVHIILILRGKRIGMSLDECREVIEMYDPRDNNSEQIHALLGNLEQRRHKLEQQKQDIDDMLSGLNEVQALCENALAEQS